MRPVTYTLSDASVAAKTSGVYPPDNYVSPFNVALSVVVDGTVDFDVEYTFDDVFAAGYDPNAAGANWTIHPTVNGAATVDGNIAYPVTGIRIKLNSGTGSVTATFIQAGGGGLA
jgi:hypothetical protein